MTERQIDKDEITRDALAQGKDPLTRKVLVALMVVTALLVVFTGLVGWQAYDGLVDSQAETEQDVDDNKAAATLLAEQLEALGERPSVDVEELEGAGPQGPQGPQGVQGFQGPPPSDAQVSRAVRLYCSSGRCDGRGPTIMQVQAAVQSYCNARGECRGAAGADGTDGTNGTDGDDGGQGPEGPAGPAPTEAQIQQAVNTYCTQNNCVGEQGPAGAPGPLCPEGYTAQERVIATQANPLGERVIICLA